MRDVGRQAGWRKHRVVARISAAQRITADSHGPVADILERKSADAAIDSDDIIAQRNHSGGAAEGRNGIGVIHFAAGSHTGDSQLRLRDVGRQAAWRGDRVITRIGATQGVTGDAHRSATHILERKRTAAGADDGDDIAAQRSHCGAAAQSRHGVGVIHLAAGSDTRDSQLGCADDSAQASWPNKRVIACIGAVQRVAADAHRSRTDILERKSTNTTSEGNDILAECRHAAPAQGRCGAGVIYLAVGGDAIDSQARWRDVGRQAGWRDHRVVARIGAAQGVTAQRHRLIADVFGNKSTDARAADGHRIAPEWGDTRSTAERGRSRAVIHFAAGAHAGDGQLGWFNCQCAVDIADLVTALAAC